MDILSLQKNFKLAPTVLDKIICEQQKSTSQNNQQKCGRERRITALSQKIK